MNFKSLNYSVGVLIYKGNKNTQGVWEHELSADRQYRLESK